MVQQTFLDYLERIITSDVKDQQLKPVYAIFEKMYQKFYKLKQLTPQTNSFKLVEKFIEFLSTTFILVGVPSAVQQKAGLMLTQIFIQTKTSYRMKKYDETKLIVKVIQQMLGSTK